MGVYDRFVRKYIDGGMGFEDRTSNELGLKMVSEFANFFHTTHLSSTFGDLAFPCRARFK